MPPGQYFSRVMIAIYTAAAFIFAFLAAYFFKKNKETEKKLEFEMADVRNMASVGSFDIRLKKDEERKKEKYKGLTTEDPEEGTGDK